MKTNQFVFEGTAMLVRLDSVTDPLLDAYARLTEAQLRNKLEPEKGIFIAEAPKVIERALAGGMECQSLLLEEKMLANTASIIETLERQDSETPVFVLPHEEIEQLIGYELTRGALGAFKRPTLRSLEDVLKGARRVAVLENITNHTNVGAIMRSAAALGIDAVLVTPECYDPLYRRAVRCSMGTVFQIPWTRIEDWPDGGMRRLHDLGFKTAALALRDDSITPRDPQLAACDKLAVVLGTEGDGLCYDTIAQCDFTVRIPMYHEVDSLNVAAASAVAFYELARPAEGLEAR